jgi:hypothetical protein
MALKRSMARLDRKTQQSNPEMAIHSFDAREKNRDTPIIHPKKGPSNERRRQPSRPTHQALR